MLSKKTSLLLIFGLLLTAWAQSEDTTKLSEHEEMNDDEGDRVLKCTHDHTERPEPELVDIDEEFPGEQEDGRVLASASNFRTYGYYGLLSSQPSTYRTYISNDLIPPILDYLESALKVKYPVSGNLKLSSSVRSVCSVSVPSVLRNGVAADFFWMIEGDYDTSSNWVADSSACQLASGSKRPIIAKTAINRNLLKATTNVLLHEKNIVCIMHEAMHTLGFSSSLYKHYLSSTGKTLTGHIKSATLDGATSRVIDVAPLTSRLRAHFGCSTLMGAYMENSGSSATAGSHFERRQFAFEFMTSGLIYEMKVTEFTLALLEGTGWYVPDYNYAEPYSWGQGQGCNFLTKSCSSSGFSFEEFCKSSSRGCSVSGMAGGSCQSDTRSDGCKFIHPNVNYHCENTGAKSNSRLANLQTFGRGSGSRCFSGTLSSSSGASTTSFCFTYSCSGSGSNTVLNINVGSKSVSCTSAGSKSVSGYKGTVNCPDPLTFCSGAGQKSCPRNCMGRGTCVNGKCQCNSGKGADCASI